MLNIHDTAKFNVHVHVNNSSKAVVHCFEIYRFNDDRGYPCPAGNFL